MKSNRERVAFRTFGCRLNQYDTESIRTLLEASGRYETAGAGAGANTPTRARAAGARRWRG